MANDRVCVFCGQPLHMFRDDYCICARIVQPCCKDCMKELRELDEAEQCRRALKLGLAKQPEDLEAHLQQLAHAEEVARTAEERRPACLRCGGKLRFQKEQMLDNSPLRDGLLSSTFDVLPAFCETCGKYEFYNPTVLKKNDYLAFLLKKDTTE